ncbi:MAG TPA: hypothetical protein VG890_12935 [Puia sp.]|nr:hypothetical protein [Puia sp.]
MESESSQNKTMWAALLLCLAFIIILFTLKCTNKNNTNNSLPDQSKTKAEKTHEFEADIKMPIGLPKRPTRSNSSAKNTGIRKKQFVVVLDTTPKWINNYRFNQAQNAVSRNSLAYYFKDDVGFIKQIDSNSLIESGLWKNSNNSYMQDGKLDIITNLSKPHAYEVESLTIPDFESLIETDQQKYILTISRLGDKLNTAKGKEKSQIWNSTYNLYLYSLQKNKAKSTTGLLTPEAIVADRDLSSENMSLNTKDVLQTYLVDLLTKLNLREIKSLRKSFNTHNTLRIMLDQFPQRRAKGDENMHEWSNHNIQNTISDLQVSDFDTLVIFDVFKDSICTHGLKVYDVVKEVLQDYGLDSQVLTKVKKVPVNYFSNKSFGDSIITAYNEAMADDDSGPMKTNAQIPPDSIYQIYHDSLEVTSQDYLNALLYTELQKTPGIITNSYTIGCRDQVYVPAGLTPAGMKYTNLLTSATNKAEDIERYRDFSSDFGAMFLEPLFSYLKFKLNTGTIIVGDELSDSTYFGMYSTEGNNINVLGKGTGWGKPNCTACIQSLDTGASFATPEIAAKLFIAKALWKKNGLLVNAIEARTRLILATELSIPFIDKFSSAGPVSLNKLLETGSGYLVDTNNRILSLEKVISASLYVNDNSGNNYYKFISTTPIATQKQNFKYTRGLYYKNSRWFIFSNESEKWEEVNEPYDLNIACMEKNGVKPEIYSLVDFKSKFKQFVLLNN